jgi:hypothetical protein
MIAAESKSVLTEFKLSTGFYRRLWFNLGIVGSRLFTLDFE